MDLCGRESGILQGCSSCSSLPDAPVPGLSKNSTIVRSSLFNRRHQSDTGLDFNEALVCNGIADGVLAIPDERIQVKKVWSYNESGLHHARQGSNTKRAHTVDVDSRKISGYAFELRASNSLHPDVFVAIHNNGATKRNACWGFVHEGDSYEKPIENWRPCLWMQSAKRAVWKMPVCMENSEPNRNDYRLRCDGEIVLL